MAYLLDGTNYAFGYEAPGFRGFKGIEEKAKGTYRSSRARQETGVSMNPFTKRRGTSKTLPRKSKAHTVKRLPYVIWVGRTR